jgi:hypothetical protein
MYVQLCRFLHKKYMVTRRDQEVSFPTGTMGSHFASRQGMCGSFKNIYLVIQPLRTIAHKKLNTYMAICTYRHVPTYY